MAFVGNGADKSYRQGPYGLQDYAHIYAVKTGKACHNEKQLTKGEVLLNEYRE